MPYSFRAGDRASRIPRARKLRIYSLRVSYETESLAWCLRFVLDRPRVRALVPSSIVGAWATMLWHTYVVELGRAIYWPRGHGVFELVTALAVGLAAAMVMFAIAYQPTPLLPRARVRHALQNVGFRATAMFAIVCSFLLVHRTVVKLPLKIDGSLVLHRCQQPEDVVCMGCECSYVYRSDCLPGAVLADLESDRYTSED